MLRRSEVAPPTTPFRPAHVNMLNFVRGLHPPRPPHKYTTTRGSRRRRTGKRPGIIPSSFFIGITRVRMRVCECVRACVRASVCVCVNLTCVLHRVSPAWTGRSAISPGRWRRSNSSCNISYIIYITYTHRDEDENLFIFPIE